MKTKNRVRWPMAMVSSHCISETIFPHLMSSAKTCQLLPGLGPGLGGE